MSTLSRRTPPAAGDRLVRALRHILGQGLVVESMESRSWTSITFAGERHQLRLRIPVPADGPAADWLEALLADAEPEIPGHKLVDLAVTDVDAETLPAAWRVSLQAVTLELD